jgi:hypothetical protein
LVIQVKKSKKYSLEKQKFNGGNNARASISGKFVPARKHQQHDSKDSKLDQGPLLQACFAIPDLWVSTFESPSAPNDVAATPSATSAAYARHHASHDFYAASANSRASPSIPMPLPRVDPLEPCDRPILLIPSGSSAGCPATSHRPFEPPSPAAWAPFGARVAAADPFHDDWPHW